jgi:hypothetical protein
VANGKAERFRQAPGQASVELLAALPALVVCVAIAASALPAGWALWTAANAARAGARAEHVRADGEAVARRALPGRLRRGASAQGGDGIRIRVRAPALLPGAEGMPIDVAAKLDPGDG